VLFCYDKNYGCGKDILVVAEREGEDEQHGGHSEFGKLEDVEKRRASSVSKR
jgi:hypothetical protein